MTDYTVIKDIRIRTKICDLMSEMLDNANEHGIYPTSRFMSKVEDFIIDEKRESKMTCWNKDELKDVLEDAINELDLSSAMIEKHGHEESTPADLVRLVLRQKDKQIRMLIDDIIELGGEEE